jgi:hypothetical protein
VSMSVCSVRCLMSVSMSMSKSVQVSGVVINYFFVNVGVRLKKNQVSFL